jgi:hypothetical protein
MAQTNGSRSITCLHAPDPRLPPVPRRKVAVVCPSVFALELIFHGGPVLARKPSYFSKTDEPFLEQVTVKPSRGLAADST